MENSFARVLYDRCGDYYEIKHSFSRHGFWPNLGLGADSSAGNDLSAAIILWRRHRQRYLHERLRRGVFCWPINRPTERTPRYFGADITGPERFHTKLFERHRKSICRRPSWGPAFGLAQPQFQPDFITKSFSFDQSGQQCWTAPSY